LPQEGREPGHAAGSGSSDAETRTLSALDHAICPTKAEIALLRAFLADEIDAILRDGE
jgi:hypothetical protein